MLEHLQQHSSQANKVVVVETQESEGTCTAVVSCAIMKNDAAGGKQNNRMCECISRGIV